MKTISVEVPDGKEARWVDGVLTLVDEAPKDITDRIKTFEDACTWCDNSDKENLTLAYREISERFNDMADMQDVVAYLKLRIITAALNEGWEPAFEEGERRFFPAYDGGEECSSMVTGRFTNQSVKLYFKSRELALYASNQFKGIYMDFCKGKE